MKYRWESVLLGPGQCIKDALELIDRESLRIAFVVDGERRLLGVISDGDIRRGLLRGLSLNSPVSAVMNASPLTAKLGTPRSELLKLMENAQLLAIPLLADGLVAGVETLQVGTAKLSHENPVFLMAGGFGKRLRPLTNKCPKPMLKIGEKPMLEILLNSFIKSGFKNFYISTHYMPEIIEDHFANGARWGVNIQYVHEDSPLGTGGALGLLPDDTPELPIILINGDVLTTVDFETLLEFHIKNSAVATMCVRDYEYQVPFGVIESDGTKVISMSEKPVQKFYVNAGIYVVNPEVREFVVPQKYIDMPMLLDQFINVDDGILIFPIHEYWLDIGRRADFERAQIDVKNLGL